MKTKTSKILDQRGVAPVLELLLVIALIGALGFVGYRAYQSRQAKPEADTSDQKAADSTADWKTYTTEKGKFTVKHPASWHAETCDDASNPALTLYLGTNSDTRVTCFSEKGSQISLYSGQGDVSSEFKLGSSFGSKTSQAVTVDGVTGEKVTGTIQALEDAPGAQPVGTIAVRYIFVTGGKTYVAMYFRTTSGDYSGNYEGDFTLLVERTLKFLK